MSIKLEASEFIKLNYIWKCGTRLAKYIFHKVCYHVETYDIYTVHNKFSTTYPY